MDSEDLCSLSNPEELARRLRFDCRGAGQMPEDMEGSRA